LKRSVCTYCGVGCEIGFSNDSILPLKDGVVSKGKLCVKGKFGHQFINHPERFTGAYVREGLLRKYGYNPDDFKARKNYRKIPYKIAYNIVARELERITSKNPESFAAIGGARTNCESAYLFQKFAREIIGSPHVDNCARICHAPSLKGLRETLGEGAASAPFDEIYRAELIFVIGSNTTEAHPIVSHRIVEQARKGIPLAVADVREIGLFRFAEFKLLLPFESNLLFLNALARAVVEKGFYDEEFLKKRVKNFKEFKEKLLSDNLSKPEIFRKIPGYEFLTDEIYRLAEFISERRTVFLWGLGVTEHEDGSEAVMAIANLALLTGNVGREGTGLIPLRGQNNVQGACDVGMLPYFLPDYRTPEKIGYMTPQIIDAVLSGEIKAIWIMGEDIAHVHPNQNKVRNALEKAELLVVNELFPCRTTEYADVIFGVKSCYEKEGVYVNAERRLHLSQPLFDSDLPDDWEVIAGVAREMGYDFGFFKTEDVWNDLRRNAPIRFGGADYSLLKENFLNAPQWPVMEGKGTERLYMENFPTADGMARLRYNKYRIRGMVKELISKGDFEGFYLTTGRILVHYNNRNQTEKCETLKKFKTFREDTVYASEEDRERLKNAKRVKLRSAYGETNPLPIEFNRHIKKGTLFASFHNPDSEINRLFGDESDILVRTAKFKSIKVSVEVVE